jgi:LmbE family N-acetylglucosaminyl deacetylase
MQGHEGPVSGCGSGAEGRPRWRAFVGRAWLAGLLLLAGLGIGGYEVFLATSSQSPQTYPTLSLEGHRSLLVIAPHCDDETIGSGGLIQAALERGLQVRVVIATAGDGYPHATMIEFRRASPSAEDYIHMGEIRQSESVNALARLGLAESEVSFLTYPEHGLSDLWWTHWRSDQPYRSPFTGLERSVYPRSFTPNTPFSGEALRDDLSSIIASEHPDLILIPHANDAHPDHRALSVFASTAIMMEELADPAYRPQVLGYLVHYGLYPQPFGLETDRRLRPPRQLQPVGQWIEWWLSSAEEATKLQAVRSYPSQQHVIGYFLDAFVSQNELFAETYPVGSIDVGQAQSLTEAAGLPDTSPGFTGISDYTPVSGGILRQIDNRADITSLHITRLGDTLWISADLRGNVNQDYTYTLYARAFSVQDSQTRSVQWSGTPSEGVRASGRTILFPVDLNRLGRPFLVAFYVDSRESTVLDSTAWYLVRLDYASPVP